MRPTAPNRRVLVPGLAALGLLVLFVGFAGRVRHQEATGVARSSPRSQDTSPAMAADEAAREEPRAALEARGGLLPGRRLEYVLRLRVETAIRDGGGAPTAAEQRIGLELAGTMELLVLAREAERAVLELSFDELSLLPVGAPLAGDAEELRAIARELEGLVTRVQVQTNGAVRGLRFPPTMGAAAREWTRTLLTSFRIVLPEEEEAARWRVVEADGHGEAIYAYRWDEAAVCAPPSRGLVKHLVERVVASDEQRVLEADSRATAVWSPSLGWIREAAVRTHLVVGLPELDAQVAQRLEGELRLSSGSFADPTSLSAVDAEEEWSPLEAVSGGEELAMETEMSRRRRELQGASLQQLLSELELALRSDGIESKAVFDAMNRLAWFLSLEPEVAFEVEGMLRSGALSGELGAMALAAIGQAGTAEGQLALTNVLSDPSLEGDLRAAALHSAFQLARPNEALRSGVLAAAAGEDPPLVRGTAMLLLGGMAGGRASLGTTWGAELLEGLLQLEAGAAAQGMADVWLEALGNAGAAAALPRIEPYLHDPSPELRAAAVSALRSVASAEATALLLDVAARDSEFGVRLDAIGVLGISGSAEAVAGLCQIAKSEANADLRQAALHAIVSAGSPSETALETLGWSAAYDSSAEVREMAAQLLAQLEG